MLVEIAPAIRRRHLAIRDAGALAVTGLAERGDFVAGKAAGFRQDGIDQIVAEIAEQAVIERLPKTGHVLQGECDLLDGRLVHAGLLVFPAVWGILSPFRSSVGRAN
jgi:hypothetical protein